MIVKTIGRGQENNIVISDNKISRVHLQLIQDDNGNTSVVDLNSTNGTYVNGKRISVETHLKVGDELRIGDTVLPWQDYFNAPTKPQTPQQQTMPQQPSKKQGFKWLYVIVGLIIILLASGGIVLHLNSKKNSEKERIEFEEKEQMKRLLNATEEDYDNLRNQNDKTKSQLEEQRKCFEEESRKSDSLAKAKNAEALRQAKTNAEQEKKDAVASAKKEAENDKENAVKAAKIAAAEKAKKEAENQAKEKIQKEQKAKEAAEEEIRLSKTFYNELKKAKDNNKLDKVCEAVLGKDVNRKERYSEIVDKYNSATTNKERQEIIDKIKDANK